MKIKQETATFAHLPKSLRGFRILHLSDLHAAGPKNDHTDIWRVIAGLSFDMIAMTGDLVLRYADELSPHLPHIAAWAKKVPVCYVDGNHEMYFYEEVGQILADIGVHVLFNRRALLQAGQYKVPVIGVRDYYYLKANRFKDIPALFSPYANSFHIVLTHQPQLFDRIEPYHIGLVLAGHTHGGQVRLPLLPTLYAPGQGLLPRYGAGWYGDAQSRLYISRGIGTTHFPLRLFNPPEITVIACMPVL